MEQVPEGVNLKVKVVPKARSNSIENWPHNVNVSELKIRVTAAPEKGQANKAVIDILSKTLNIGKSNVILLNGGTSRNKTFLLKGITIKDIQDVEQLI